MELTKESVLQDIRRLPVDYKTGDVDRLIKGYVRERADVSDLRNHILERQELHRIYFYVSMAHMKSAEERMAFIHENLLFSDWWHTDQLISFVADLEFDTALRYAQGYIRSDDPYVRRWGYVLFISRLCRGRAESLLMLMRDDEHYHVRMAQAWLIAELAVFQPEAVYDWFPGNGLGYDINGKAIQKICDSFRISKEWKERFKALRPGLRQRK